MENQVTVLGIPLAGKTVYLNTIIHKKDRMNTVPTIGAAYYKSQCNDINFNIYDTAGLELYRQFQMHLFIRNSKIVCFFYDITNIKGLEEVNRSIQLSNLNNSNYIRFIIGNKIDQEKIRMITYQQGEINAEMNKAFFYEISCLTQKGVFESFYLMFLLYKEKMLNEEEKKELFIKSIENKNNCLLF